MGIVRTLRGALFLASFVSGLAVDKPAFEVASIKVNGSVGESGMLKPTPDGLMIENYPMTALIAWAWNLPPYEVLAPPWFKGAQASAGYDIVAKAAGPAPRDQLRLMLQTLLEERFHLAVHFEKKDTPVYELVLAKGGAKALREPEPGHDTRTELGSTDAAGKHWVFHNEPLSALAGLYSATALGRPILDRTGLTGKYDFTFVEPPGARDGPYGEFIVGEIFPEMQRQLGIRVEARTAPIDVLVIDRVDRNPVEN
jgi:uncharacterized protein (TIGR03435 family)